MREEDVPPAPCFLLTASHREFQVIPDTGLETADP